MMRNTNNKHHATLIWFGSLCLVIVILLFAISYYSKLKMYEGVYLLTRYCGVSYMDMPEEVESYENNKLSKIVARKSMEQLVHIAIDSIKLAATLNPFLENAHYYLAKAYILALSLEYKAKGKYNESTFTRAESEHLQAIKYAPCKPENYIGLVGVYTVWGKYNVAIKLVKKYHANCPDDSSNYEKMLGWAYYETGDYINAISMGDRIVKRKQDAPTGRILIALSAIKFGDCARARAQLQEIQLIIQTEPDFSSVYQKMLKEYLKTHCR